MKYLIGFLLILGLIHISRCFGEVDYERLADKVTNQTAKRLLIEKNLHCVGISGGMMGLIQRMGMVFDYNKSVSLEEARRLAVYAMGKYRKDINASKEIRPYLIEYPFPIDRLKISISFYKDDSLSQVDADQISTIFLFGDIVQYCLPSKGESIVLHQETYEEALKIVQEETNKGPTHEK